jgi:quercetin dioxygenase-like cupin family protein
MTTADETWVEVRDEPRHRRRFENEFVRVYDVLIPPGDTTLYHRHTEDTLYVAVNEVTVRDRTWGAPDPRTGTSPAGSCLCRPHRSRPLIHQVHNLGPGEMRLIGAEIKATPPLTTAEPFSAPGFALTLERDRLRVYELSLEPGASTGPFTYGFWGLTVMLTVATVQVESGGRSRTHVYAPGDVIWQPGPTELTITNVGEEPCRSVVGEWR